MKALIELELDDMNMIILALASLVEDTELTHDEKLVLLSIIRKFKVVLIEFMKEVGI